MCAKSAIEHKYDTESKGVRPANIMAEKDCYIFKFYARDWMNTVIYSSIVRDYQSQVLRSHLCLIPL
jgi:hypothetical protein